MHAHTFVQQEYPPLATEQPDTLTVAQLHSLILRLVESMPEGSLKAVCDNIYTGSSLRVRVCSFRDRGRRLYSISRTTSASEIYELLRYEKRLSKVAGT